MDLVRHVDVARPRQAIVRSRIHLCKEMGIQIIAEGVETAAKRDFLFDQGIELMQGYLFAKPAFRAEAKLESSAFDVQRPAPMALWV
jgi:EAL domain-containing protein (putative c-di-GMP-specific phosphodiesterase class I)